MSNEHITDEQLQAEQFEHLLNIGLRDELRPAIPAVMWLFRAWLESAALRPAAQLVGEPSGAPSEIWLQINADGSPDDTGYPADHEGVTWCWHSIGGQEVRYVRADIAAQPLAAPDRVPMTDEQLCEALSIDGADRWTYEVRDAVERFHGITTPKADK